MKESKIHKTLLESPFKNSCFSKVKENKMLKSYLNLIKMKKIFLRLKKDLNLKKLSKR